MEKIITAISITKNSKNLIHESKAAFYEDFEIKIHINNDLIINFIALNNDLEFLVKGYFYPLPKNVIKNIKIEKNNIFVNLKISKNELLNFLNDNEIIQSCESIVLMDNRIYKNKTIVPFNDSRAKIINNIGDYYNDFIIKNNDFYRAEILFQENENYTQIAESYDTNKKNTIYKIIGKATNERDNLLDCTIFINFKIDIETLKKIILSKITFIVFVGKPSFVVLKYAQKFGLTLMQCINNKEIQVLTHSMRIKS